MIIYISIYPRSRETLTEREKEGGRGREIEGGRGRRSRETHRERERG